METPEVVPSDPPKKRKRGTRECAEPRRSSRARVSNTKYEPTLQTRDGRGNFQKKWTPKERQILIRALNDRKSASAQGDFLAIKKRIKTKTKEDVEQIVNFLRKKASVKKIEDAKTKSPIEIWNDLLRDFGDDGEVTRAMSKSMLHCSSERVTQPSVVKQTDFNPSQVYRYLGALMKQSETPRLSPLESQVIVDCFESMLDVVKSSDMKKQTEFLQRQYFQLCNEAFTGGQPFDQEDPMRVFLSGQTDEVRVEQSALDIGSGQPGTSREEETVSGQPGTSREEETVSGEVVQNGPSVASRNEDRSDGQPGTSRTQEPCDSGQVEKKGPSSVGRKGAWRGSPSGSKTSRLLNPLGIPPELLRLCARESSKKKKKKRAGNRSQGNSSDDDDDDDDNDDGGDDIYRGRPGGDDKKRGVEREDVGNDHRGDDNPGDLAGGKEGTSGVVHSDQFHDHNADVLESSPTKPAFQAHIRPSSHSDSNNPSSSSTKGNIADSSDDEDILMAVKRNYSLYTKMAPGTYKGGQLQRQAVSKISPEELLFGASPAKLKKETIQSSFGIKDNHPVARPALKSDVDNLTDDMETLMDYPQSPQSPAQIPGTLSPQSPAQIPGTLSPQSPTQIPGTLSPQSPAQIPGMLSPQSPAQIPGTLLPQLPAQIHGTLSPRSPAQSPGSLSPQSPGPEESVDDLESEEELSHAGNQSVKIKSEPVEDVDDLQSKEDERCPGKHPMGIQGPPVVRMEDIESERDQSGNRLLRIDLSQLDPESNIVIPASVLPGGILTIQSLGMSEDGSVALPTTKDSHQVKAGCSVVLPNHQERQSNASRVKGKKDSSLSSSVIPGQDEDKMRSLKEKEPNILPQRDGVATDEADASSDAGSANVIESSFEEGVTDKPSKIESKKEIEVHQGQGDLPTIDKKKGRSSMPGEGLNTEEKDVSSTIAAEQQSDQCSDTPKRGRGRPRKPKQPNTEPKQERALLPGRAKAAGIAQTPKEPKDVAKKRGRGRPRKTPLKEAPAQSLAANGPSQPGNTTQGGVNVLASKNPAEMQILLLSQALEAIAQIGKNLNASLQNLNPNVGQRGFVAPVDMTGAVGLSRMIESVGQSGKSIETGHFGKSLDVDHSGKSLDNGHPGTSLVAGHSKKALDSGHSEKSLDARHSGQSSDFGHSKKSLDSGHSRKSLDSGHSESKEELQHSTVSQREMQTEKLQDAVVRDSDSIDKQEMMHVSSSNDVDVEIEQSELNKAVDRDDSEVVHRSNRPKGAHPEQNTSDQSQDLEARQPIKDSDVDVASSSTTLRRSPRKGKTSRITDHFPIKEKSKEVVVKQEMKDLEDLQRGDNMGHSEDGSEDEKEDQRSKSNQRQQKKKRKACVLNRPNKRRRTQLSASATSDLSAGGKSIVEKRQTVESRDDSDDDHSPEKPKRGQLAKTVESLSSPSQGELSPFLSPEETDEEPDEVDASPIKPRQNELRAGTENKPPRTSFQDRSGKFSKANDRETLLACFAETPDRVVKKPTRISNLGGTGKVSNASNSETLLSCFSEDVQTPVRAVVFSLKKR